MGVDLSSPLPLTGREVLSVRDGEAFVSDVFARLRGAFVHSLLEWTAVMLALLTATLAFVQYNIRRDLIACIMGYALLSSGLLDAFHTLAADRLIGRVHSNPAFLPFTWGLARNFQAGILLLGATLLLGRKKPALSERRFVLAVGTGFVLLALGSMMAAVYSPVLPQSQVADGWVRRPLDFVALTLFALAAAWLFPRLYHSSPSLFTRTLVLSLIPLLVAQCFMAFAAERIYDASSNVAHALKVFSFGVILTGLIGEYVAAHRRERRWLTDLERAKEELSERAQRLTREVSERMAAEQRLEVAAENLHRSNEELEHFAYIASHDLQEPLRTVGSFAQLLSRKYSGKLDAKADQYIGIIVDGAARMQTLINDLLLLSRVERKGRELIPTSSCDALTLALANLQASIQETSALIHAEPPLPMVLADEGQLVQLFQNLVGNAIKFYGEEPPRVRISAQREGEMWRFSIADNGIGIDAEYFERIFIAFQRLHTRDSYQGTGIGLAVCRKIVERHGGDISVASSPGQGSTFSFTLRAA